ncbi:MAG: hypothetical protein E6J90_34300 [Deltaproteobacteria bacterium]|nr:MAG: hypothetical protein E6J90_34300 [Deltaproteobacteria bacterium]
MQRFRSLGFVILVSACGHHGGGGDGGMCDPMDPACGTPTHPVIVGCSGCPTFPPPGSSPPPCSGQGTAPQLVYPPDQVLLPPNMNVIEVQFLPGTGNTVFEIDFANAGTDVRFETKCTAITSTRGQATGGCAFALDPTDWSYVATHNRGGDPVTVTVRAAPENLSCVSGSNSRMISYAAEDLAGGIYYWQSTTQNGVAGKTGGIFRKDFGNPDPTPEPFLTPGNLNKCVGCHFLSRDGLVMTYGSDDADSDDEYGDLKVVLYDVTKRTATATNLPAGFQTFKAAGHDMFFASDGRGQSNSPELLAYSGTTGQSMTSSLFAGLTGKRVTHPDWSRDGATIYFTLATAITGLSGYNLKDDLHVTNGSIYAATASGTGATNPVALVTAASADENNYYPAISPDGRSVIFDRAVGTTLATHDSYNNPNAKLFAVPATGGTPVELKKANYADGMTNSWPRWSPFVQMYKGKRILWVTFSSTRDYGLRVRNEGAPYFNCYPPVSPEDTSGDHAKPFDPNCTQPQIWMTAISLDDLAAGGDGSFPAFWLPFQDYTAHNHIAQWVEMIVKPPTGCAPAGASCVSQMCCDGLGCDQATKTCQPIIF